MEFLIELAMKAGFVWFAMLFAAAFARAGYDALMYGEVE